ncbi:hypothetical protein LTR86_008731 [Recurvomyces mirabilis]|nr:hypothetical protein LTR86_008731 [Recurvomyces mirabilis]
MSDFSAFALFTAGLACFIPAVAAWTQPVGDSPSGNPISQPGLNSVVPVGQPFTITWQPTTSGTVTIVLLKGPSSNAVPQYAIVEKIQNSGSYAWTPSTDLAPGDTGYGLQLIDDENGQYQYSTQWGISNPSYVSSSSSASASTTVTVTSSASSSDASASSASWAHGGNPWDTAINSWFSASAWTTDGSWSSATGSWSSSATGTATVTVPANGTASATKNTTMSVPTATAVVSYSMPANTSVVLPTNSMTVPSSLKTSATASSSVSAPSASRPATTNAANTMATSFAGLVVAAGVAVFAL